MKTSDASSPSSLTENNSNVRKRASAVCATASGIATTSNTRLTHPVYCSQDDDQMETSHTNEAKRPRLREPESPRIVSLPCMTVTDMLEDLQISGPDNRVRVVTTVNKSSSSKAVAKVEWWKQQRLKPRHPPLIELNTLRENCIVCRLPCFATETGTAATTTAAITQKMDVVVASPTSRHQTTLLQYFPPKFFGKSLTDDNGFVEKKRSKMVLSPPPPLHPPRTSQFACCTFCEKAVCVSCQAICEVCQLVFCSFCSTKDYGNSGPVERVVCLDCRDRSKESLFHMLID